VRTNPTATRFRYQLGSVLRLLLGVSFLHFFCEAMMTKIDAVYLHLKKHGHITSWEAINLYKATRLADIIYKLKLQGFKIVTLMVEGENTRFARYFIKDRK
jgi:hypothetical protein